VVDCTIDIVGKRYGVMDECNEDRNVPIIPAMGKAKKQISTAAARGNEYVHGKNNGLSFINKPAPRMGAMPSN
jgi:hypothetical protein